LWGEGGGGGTLAKAAKEKEGKRKPELIATKETRIFQEKNRWRPVLSVKGEDAREKKKKRGLVGGSANTLLKRGYTTERKKVPPRCHPLSSRNGGERKKRAGKRTFEEKGYTVLLQSETRKRGALFKITKEGGQPKEEKEKRTGKAVVASASRARGKQIPVSPNRQKGLQESLE